MSHPQQQQPPQGAVLWGAWVEEKGADHSSEDGWIKTLKTFASELLHLVNASQSVFPAGSQLVEGRSRAAEVIALVLPGV